MTEEHDIAKIADGIQRRLRPKPKPVEKPDYSLVTEHTKKKSPETTILPSGAKEKRVIPSKVKVE